MMGSWAYLIREEALPLARAAAQKALEIDDTLTEAHTSMGEVKILEWDWPSAERDLIRALELDPDYATAHNWYGDLLTIRGQLEAGAAEKRKGQASDPLSLILNTDIGRDFMFRHQWDRAIAQLQTTLEMDPNFVVAHRWLVWAYWGNGLREEAIARSEKYAALERRVAYLPRFLRQVVSDNRAEAIRTLTNSEGDPFNLALYYTLAGDNDSAFHWLAQAINEHRMGAAYLRVYPQWDSLRDDPRFQDLLLRINLEA